MRVIGSIGFLYVAITIGWIVFHIVHQTVYPVQVTDGDPASVGIAYYSQHRGILGLDHGSKALTMLLTVSIPIYLYAVLKKYSAFSFVNVIALISGITAFILNAVSLILQATTVEYAFKLFALSDDAFTKKFATLLYDWAMLQGGFSVSLYILANIALSVWVVLHSFGLFKFMKYKKLGRLGIVFGIMQIIGMLLSWFYLMHGEQNLHTINEIIGFIFIIWLAMISYQIMLKKLTNSVQEE